jgi:predicted nucleic acid-binding protein
MPSRISQCCRVKNNAIEFGLLDTSVVVDLNKIPRNEVPFTSCISALTLAELSAGLAVAKDQQVRLARQHQLQLVESTIELLPFDSQCARMYSHIVAAVHAIGRKTRGPRTVDLMIAATAMAHRLPLYTRNVQDLKGCEKLIEIIKI